MISTKINTSADDILPRSLLYCLEPLGNETSDIECLTSYVNRLAWSYCIGPRTFIAELIILYLNETHSLRVYPHRLSPFCREDAMSINAAGENAIVWRTAIERLTSRSDISSLTLSSWASGLSIRGLLRRSPAWCPYCYTYWQVNNRPIYQPLHWMFQVVKICIKHKNWLEERCSYCHKYQSAIAVKTPLGYCTQCATWLGMEGFDGHEINEEILVWQEWVLKILNELQQTGIPTHELQWKNFSANLALCTQLVGGTRPLARMIGLPPSVPRHWILGQSIPSFQCLAELCYVFDISPVQIILNAQASFFVLLQTRKFRHLPMTSRLTYHQVDSDRILELMCAILDDKEPLLAVRQIERRFGLGDATLVKHFPKECALLSAKYVAYCEVRSQLRVERECEEVRQATIALHQQGMYPSRDQIAARLSSPDLMRRPACRAAWHATKEELGI